MFVGTNPSKPNWNKYKNQTKKNDEEATYIIICCSH